MCVDWGVSIRKACEAICFDTSTYHYKSRRTDQAAVERRNKEIAQTRVRYGYRRVHVLLRRKGWVINMKKTRRIYNELGLQLRSKHPKRRVKAKLREDRQEAVGPNDVWAMDFVHEKPWPEPYGKGPSHADAEFMQQRPSDWKMGAQQFAPIQMQRNGSTQPFGGLGANLPKVFST